MDRFVLIELGTSHLFIITIVNLWFRNRSGDNQNKWKAHNCNYNRRKIEQKTKINQLLITHHGLTHYKKRMSLIEINHTQNGIAIQ